MEANLKLEINLHIKDSDIDDIVCCALEGGINYWCCRAEVIGDYLGEYAHEQISKGGTLILHDAESDDKWELTKEKLMNGLALFLPKRGKEIWQDTSIDVWEIDTCNSDASDADEIIQYALFGEVQFG